MATAARDVAETAIPSAFKNGSFPTVGKLKTVENKPFPDGGNRYLETLNLNSYNNILTLPTIHIIPILTHASNIAMAQSLLAQWHI